MTKYGSAYKRVKPKKGEDPRVVNIEQGVKDLPTCRKDIDDILNALKYYEVTDTGLPENPLKYKLYEPTKQQVNDAIKELKARIAKNPEKKFFIIFCVASHGLMSDGR